MIFGSIKSVQIKRRIILETGSIKNFVKQINHYLIFKERSSYRSGHIDLVKILLNILSNLLEYSRIPKSILEHLSIS